LAHVYCGQRSPISATAEHLLETNSALCRVFDDSRIQTVDL